MSLKKRILSVVLSIVMVFELLPLSALAAENSSTVTEDGLKVTISAEAENTITVREKTKYGTISILADKSYNIDRDYEQLCEITVHNSGQEAKKFYLNADNVYDDLSYQFIGDGSADVPMLLASDESVKVTLSVFAQNAEKETYNIPVTAYVLDGEKYVEDSKCFVTLNCDLPKLNLSWNLVSSSDTSLSQTYRITNNGGILTDLTVAASDELKDYVSFSPVISNYELERGNSVEVKVYPDLAKMKNEDITSLTGTLLASCAGKISEQECIFDTEGKEITVTTMGELALKQDGNPFTKFEVDKDSVSFQYFNGTEYIDVSTDAELNLDDILDGDGSFNIRNEMDVDLGVEKPLTISTVMKATPLDDEFEKKEETEFKELEDGSIEVTIRNIIDANEFWEYFNNLQEEQKLSIKTSMPGQLVSVYSISSEDLDEASKIGTEFVTTFYGLMDEVDNIEIPGSKGVKVLGYVYDIYSIADGIRKTANVFSDPRLSDEVKQKYHSYHLGNIIMTEISWASAFLPFPANLVVSTGAYLFSKYLDGKQEAFLEQAYSEIYEQILGSQCTNRGSISAKFYVPDYSKGTTKPSMYASTRMSDQGYVNKADTNYDISLNGEQAVETSNSGLTDVVMKEIPTDNLKLGEENEIVFDYDTSPGSHSVSTDTEITLLYPMDTEIAYISNPDDLQDVRTKPDFAVYSENIYADAPVVIGEETTLHFNVYNTGSRGGWFTVVCVELDEAGNPVYDIEGNPIYKEENHYLAAFSGEQFSILWTPEKENTIISVQLENTSVNLEERDKYVDSSNAQHNVRDDRNNYAETVMSARKREIPQIEVNDLKGIYENQAFSIIVDVTKCADLESVKFTYGNGEIIEAIGSGSGDYRRYCLNFSNGLPADYYRIYTMCTYRDSANSTSEKSYDFVFNVDQILPSADDVNTTLLYGETLDFSIYNLNHWTHTSISVDDGDKIPIQPTNDDDDLLRRDYSVDLSEYENSEHKVDIWMYYEGTNGREYSVQKTGKVVILSEDDSYFTFSISDDIEFSSLDFALYKNNYSSREDIAIEETESGYRFLKTLDMIENSGRYHLVASNNSSVFVIGLTENSVIEKDDCHTITVTKENEADKITSARITGISDLGIYTDIEVSLDELLLLTPGKYTLNVKGTVDEVSFDQSIEIDVTEQNQEISLNSFILIYTLDVTNAGSSAEKYQAYLYTFNNDHWSSSYLNADDRGNGIVKCYSQYNYIFSKVEQSIEARLLIWSNTEIYWVLIKDENGILVENVNGEVITLDRKTLNKVSFISREDNFQIGKVDVLKDDYDFRCYLHGDTIYVPNGKYVLDIGLTDNVQTFSESITIDVTKDCKIPIGKNDEEDREYSNVTVKWTEPFADTADVNCYNGQNSWQSYVKAASGETFKVLNGTCNFRVLLNCERNTLHFIRNEVLDGEDIDITIGNELTGICSIGYRNKYEVGDIISLSIQNVQDRNDNKLDYVHCASSLKGWVTYTDVKDSERVFKVPVSTNNLYSISANLPDEAGEYSVSVMFNVDSEEDETVFTVTFDANNAGVTSNTIANTVRGELTNLPKPEMSDYVFNGWYTETGDGTKISLETIFEADTIVYAHWTKTSEEEYIVTFDTNGGSISDQTIETTNGRLLELPTPVRSGYTFDGWYTGIDTRIKINVDTVFNMSRTLYAHWVEKSTDPGEDDGTGGGDNPSDDNNSSSSDDNGDNPNSPSDGNNGVGDGINSNGTETGDSNSGNISGGNSSGSSISGIGNVSGGNNGSIGDVPSVMEKQNLNLAKVNIKNSMTYIGKKLKPEVSIVIDGVIIASSEYTVSYSNNKNVGTATVVITAKSDSTKYEGTVYATFKIKKAKQKISLSKTSKIVKSKARKVKFNLKVSGAKGALKVSSNNRGLKVVKSGKKVIVTIGKTVKKGIYVVKIRAKKTSNYKASSTKKCIVTVK